jgi:hypothetical protein
MNVVRLQALRKMHMSPNENELIHIYIVNRSAARGALSEAEIYTVCVRLATVTRRPTKKI